MAKGTDESRNGARIVDMKTWKMRNHPATSGGGKKPPNKPITKTGGSGDDSPYESNRDDANPYGMPRPQLPKRESREDKYKNGWYN